MLVPIFFSMTVSVSTKSHPSRRDNCRPTVDLPPPGNPTSAMGFTKRDQRDTFTPKVVANPPGEVTVMVTKPD